MPRTVASREPCVPGRRPYTSHKDHAFSPSGVTQRYLCALHGCRSAGLHHACAVCGRPEDEHPRPTPGDAPHV
jgi:hypothetical protein